MGALEPELRDAPRAVASGAGRADRSFVGWAGVGWAVRVGAEGDRAGAPSGTSRGAVVGDSVGDSGDDDNAVLALGRSGTFAASSGARGSTGGCPTAGPGMAGDDCAVTAAVSTLPSPDCLVLAASASSPTGSASDGGSIAVNVLAGVSVGGATGADATATGSRPAPALSASCGRSSNAYSRTGLSLGGIARSVVAFGVAG
jgi:hypothetical protein